MITYVNSSNTQKYSALFAKATKALEGSSLPEERKVVNDIEEYFNVIKELAAIDPVFTRLPLDEDVFTIDANARLINVPNSFKTNGISVKGDEISEILYFKINRFFDATDLGWVKDDKTDPNRAISDDRMNIVIQWETAPDSNGTTQQGASAAWAVDIETDPDFVIFGWPIDSRITENAGAVKFSVRFFRYNEDKTDYAYSFSTLTASVNIKPALDYDLINGVACAAEINKLVLGRIEDGNVSGTRQAETPIFTLISWLNGTPIKDEDDKIIARSVDLDSNGRLTLKAQAFAPDSGIITYEWHREGDSMPIGQDCSFIETEDESFNEQKLYYKQAASLPPSYEQLGDVVTGGNIAEYKEEHSLDAIFEKITSYLIVDDGTLSGSAIGNYWVRAINASGRNIKELDSVKCTIPAPEKPTTITNLNAEGNIIRDGWEGLKFEASTDHGSISYKWAVDGEIIEGATSSIYKPLTEGNYQAIAVNTLNGGTESRNSVTAKVTLPADVPVIDLDNTDYSRRSLATEPILSFALLANEHHDTYEYQWYEEAGVEDILINGATNSTYAPDHVGAYYCKITNIYNLDRASADTDVFDVSR